MELFISNHRFYSTSLISPPPKQVSSKYKTRDCPCVMALWGSSNTTLALLSLISTLQVWSGCLYLIFAFKLYDPSGIWLIKLSSLVVSLEEKSNGFLFPWATIRELRFKSFFITYQGESEYSFRPPIFKPCLCPIV